MKDYFGLCFQPIVVRKAWWNSSRHGRMSLVEVVCIRVDQEAESKAGLGTSYGLKSLTPVVLLLLPARIHPLKVPHLPKQYLEATVEIMNFWKTFQTQNKISSMCDGLQEHLAHVGMYCPARYRDPIALQMKMLVSSREDSDPL